MARLRASWRTSLPVVQQPRNPQFESIARSPYDLAPERNRAGGRCWRACPRPRGPGGLASVQATCGPGQHHPHAASGQGARVEPRREHLAVHARELDLQPHLRVLPRHPRSLLRRMEQAHGPALAHHVHRTAGLGSPVLIIGTWYNALAEAFAAALGAPVHAEGVPRASWENLFRAQGMRNPSPRIRMLD